MADQKKKEAPLVAQEGKKLEEEQVPEKTEEEKLLGKFKTQDELAEAYKGLEKKLGEQGDELRQGREFATAVRPLLDEIRGDPELFKKLEGKFKNKDQSTETNSTKAEGEEKVTNQDESRQVVSDLLLARFEEKHGIDKLPADEKKDVRRKIGDTIHDLTGQYFNDVDLRRLNTVLENSYLLANKDELIGKSKLEALASAGEVSEGGIPSVPSSPGKTDTVLNSEEADVAEKMGLTRKQYLEGKEKLAK